MMAGRQQQPVERLVDAALELPPEQRRAFLDRACSDDPDLRSQIEKMLHGQQNAVGSPKPLSNGSEGNGSTGTANPDETQSILGDSFRQPSTIRNLFLPDQVIAGRFVVVRLIARGGMGEVYEVKDRYLQDSRVALKIILPEIAAEASASQRFQQEVLLARRVNHPNLCPIYEIFRCDDPPPPFLFLTMKLLEGETLASRLRQPQPIPRDEALEIFRQMISGIAAIHAAGVIHRDIKPNNVMLDRSGADVSVSIMDFGLARGHQADATVFKPGHVAGTPGYLAPELHRGEPPSQASDIYALGVLLYQVLTGERPTKSPEKPAPDSAALDSANVPLVYIRTVREFLRENPQRRSGAFAEIQTFLNSKSSPQDRLNAAPHLFTRRSFAIASGVTAIAAASGAIWKHQRLYDLFHPLPQKRFVALLGWPPLADIRFKPMLLGLIDAIGEELSRAEAFDHNLYVIPHSTPDNLTTPAQLNDLRESLGANLVLATSGSAPHNEYQVSLQVLDPYSAYPLRTREVRVPTGEQLSLPAKVVRAAADLLDITGYQPDDKRSAAGTSNPDALTAFQAAEALYKEPNDTGVEPAIEKYKEALDLDPRFAQACARLGGAYLRLYAMHGDSTSLDLARANCETSLILNHDLVEGHIGLAWVLEETGDRDGALREFEKAIAIDPSNPRTLTYQAQMYSELNRWDDADKAYRRVLKERPNYWLPHDELGMNLYWQAKYSEALEQVKQASLAAPKNALALSNVGIVSLRMGRYDDALSYLNKSMSVKPNGTAAATIAELLRIQGKYADALIFSAQSVQLQPSDSTNWLRMGDCNSMVHGHSADAKSAYTRAAAVQADQLQTDPANGPGWMLLALYRIKSGKPEEAAALVKKAGSLHAGDVDSQLYKVRILALLGDHDGALAILRYWILKGATRFQIESMMDLESLRKDPRYLKLFAP